MRPANPRDSARLLVYRRKSGKIFFDTFRNLNEYLPEGAVLVFNQTKVLPARISARKATGGKVKLLYLQTRGREMEFLCEKKLPTGSKIYLSPKKYFVVSRKAGSSYFLRPSFSQAAFLKILKATGETPIPPYLRHTPLKEPALRKFYQTVFAKQEGSAAAPTASLHFTKPLLKKLRAAGHYIQFITLHVGLGTFASLTPQAIESGRLHQEKYSISKSTAKLLNQAKRSGRPIIAVGTTVARTLESAAVCRSGQPVGGGAIRNPACKIKRLEGGTSLFIREGYKFRFIDGLITNFHVPQSSLLMLVAAMIGRERLLKIYRSAIVKRFRFFSFGDGMLIK